MNAINCLEQVARAAGRKLSDEELEGIYDSIGAEMRRIRAEKRLAGLEDSPETLTREAAESAATRHADEARLKRVRTALTILAHDRNMRAVQSHGDGMMRGLLSLMVRDKADRANVLSGEAREMAIRNEAMGRLVDLWTASGPKLFGLLTNNDGIRTLMRALYGQKTGVKAADDAAQAWREVTEGLRQRFNRAGGDIGRLDDWSIPQHHSQRRVMKAGRDQWIADILPRLNRERYVNDDGSLYTDQQMLDLLGAAYETISTGGLNKLQPGQAGRSGMRANRGSEARQLHFKSADDYLDYQKQYGDRNFYQVLTGHVAGMANDIALVEQFGPNPDHMFRTLYDVARKSGDRESAGLSLQNVYDELSGKTNIAEHQTLGRFSQGLRNIQIAAKLGGAFLSSIPDAATLYITGQVANLPAMRVASNQLAALNPANQMEKRMAQRAGLALDTLLGELNRFGEEGFGSGVTAKFATLTMRASGLASWTEANKRAFGVTMMSSIGAAVKTKSFKALEADDMRILRSKGITETDWAIWKLAKQEDWGNGNDTMLTPASIRAIPDEALAGLQGNPTRLRDEATAKLLGAVLEESDNAVITAGVREKALLKQGTQKGTVKGEIVRSIVLFKSFPTAMIARHWTRAVNMPTTQGKIGYTAALFSITTLLGYLAMSAKDIARGQDPKDPSDIRTWVAAAVQGGGAGIYGDFVLADVNRYGNTPISTLAGPVATTLEDAFNLTVGNIRQAAEGKDTNIGAEALRFAKSNTPMANLWYTRAALDHAILHDMQEYLSPGYLRKLRGWSRKEFNQDYWWQPGETLPERAPQFSESRK